VNGVLNAYKDGRIGGNVFFSDSHGFIVGQHGTINVGRLTVNTPTDKFLDGVVGADGRVDDAAADRLMRGDIPLSADGVISISGTINARNGITLQGQSVAIYGSDGSPITGDDLTHRQKFEATVNASGISEGGRLIARNGSVEIVSAGDTRIAGQVRAGTGRHGPGKITVRSGGSTTLAATARLSADGVGAAGAGGDISIIATQTVNAQSGAQLSVHGSGTGAGGMVELSGHVANIGAISVDLGSDAGAAGKLLFDPYDLTIVSSSSITSHGGSVELDADHSITLASGGFINTTNGGSQAGEITLKAPSITLSDGSVLNAGSGGTAGDITLEALQPTGGVAQITIGNATLSGGDINLTAT